MKGVDDVCGRVIRLLMGERKKRTRGGPGAKRKRPKGLTPASADTSVMFHPDGFSLFLCLFWPTLLFLWIQFDKRKPLFFSTTPKNDEWVLNTTVDAIHPKPPTWLVDNPRDKEYTGKKSVFFFFFFGGRHISHKIIPNLYLNRRGRRHMDFLAPAGKRALGDARRDVLSQVQENGKKKM